MKNLKKIKGDASVRKFYRKKNDSFNSIVVFAKKDKFKNLLVYDAINKILIKNNILAPALYLEKYNKGDYDWHPLLELSYKSFYLSLNFLVRTSTKSLFNSSSSILSRTFIKWILSLPFNSFSSLA